LGEKSFGPLLEVLGVKLAVLEDPAAMARLEKRRQPRTEHQVRDGMRSIAGIRRREWLFSPEKAKQCAALRMAKLSPKKRQKLARGEQLAHAGVRRARWSNDRVRDL
jgi:hypothetical protein